MSATIVAGQTFSYRAKRRFFRAQAGAGQVLGCEEQHRILFVRLFDVSGDEVKPFVGFLPIAFDAYSISHVRMLKWLPIPNDWEVLRDEWRTRWLSGEAGAFSQPLGQVTEQTLSTVNYLREGGYVELAYPKLSASGRFDSIEAFVRLPTS
jgi:hypothetical protein